MIDVDYGYVKIKLSDYMKKNNISVSKLAYRAEMQRTQLKTYMNQSVVRVDLAVLARLCYALQCDLPDLIEYVSPEKK